MLKVLIIAATNDRVRSLDGTTTVARVQPGAAALEALQKKEHDLVIVGNQAAMLLNQAILGAQPQHRINVMASTHQGIQLVPINEVYYFQAEHKYVVTYHSQGQLLIDDALDKLEQDFAVDFIRIHRKTLVAIAKIDKLLKTEAGQHYIKLRGSATQLQVSRRQLSKVRKILLCT